MSTVDDDEDMTESFRCMVMVPKMEKRKHSEMKKGGKEEYRERERPIPRLCIKSKKRRPVCVCARTELWCNCRIHFRHHTKKYLDGLAFPEQV